VGIFQSEDNGEYWIQVNNGLTTTDITALVFDYDGNLYAGTFPVWGEGGGVCRSTDNGNSWTELNDGLTNLEVSFLFGDYINLLYVGTSNGLFIYNYDLFSCLSESMQRHADSPVKFCFSN
jgi:ligand-binding sensor domain-containing protein